MAVRNGRLPGLTELLWELCMLNGTSGNEEEVREYIKEKAAPFADDIKTDSMGNLIVFKKGSASLAKSGVRKKIMLAAHMDEVGFIVLNVTDEGYIQFRPAGGVDPRVVLGHKVYVGPKELPGVIGLKAIHLTRGKDREVIPKWADMYIDIGAADKESALKKVSLGDPIYFDSDFVYMGKGKSQIKAKAIDDRFGCAVMLKLMEEKLPCDITFVFTVQEEVGTRGAFGAGFELKPDIALILEGTTAADLAGVKAQDKVTRLGAGPVIGFMDAGTIYDRGLFEQIRDAAEANEIPWQIKSRIAGGTDARTIQRSREGVRVASISVPVRNIHSANTVANVGDINNAYELAKLAILEMA